MRNLFIALLAVLLPFAGPAGMTSLVAQNTTIQEKTTSITTKDKSIEQAKKAFKRALEEGLLTKPGLVIEGVGTKQP
jgi:hypothetical protein